MAFFVCLLINWALNPPAWDKGCLLINWALNPPAWDKGKTRFFSLAWTGIWMHYLNSVFIDAASSFNHVTSSVQNQCDQLFVPSVCRGKGGGGGGGEEGETRNTHRISLCTQQRQCPICVCGCKQMASHPVISVTAFHIMVTSQERNHIFQFYRVCTWNSFWLLSRFKQYTSLLR